MRNQDESPGLKAVIGSFATIAAVAFTLHLLPNEVRMILTAWTLASFPIGILIGHCVLNEE
jgi:hypothetical protein